MNHWTFIEDSFFLNKRGLVVAFLMPHGFTVSTTSIVTLFGLNDVVITSTVGGVENFRPCMFDMPAKIGVYIKGFDEKVDMKNWLMCVHEPRIEIR